MGYTLGQAAKATGVSKMTLSRAIKKGIISASKNESGGYIIDPSELHRVFPPVTLIQSQDDNNVTKRYTDDTPLLQQLKALEFKLEVTEERLEETKQERDDWKEQAKRLALTYTKPVESENPPISPPNNRFRLSSSQVLVISVVIIAALAIVLLETSFGLQK
jgi:DNA-binding transcriptional MerR regulator